MYFCAQRRTPRVARLASSPVSQSRDARSVAGLAQRSPPGGGYVPLFCCRASPYAVDDLVVQRPGQAGGLDRADSADPLRFFNLVKRRSRLPDREEGVRIGVPAGGAVA